MNKRRRKKLYMKTLRRIGKTCAVITGLGPNQDDKIYFISREGFGYFGGGMFDFVNMSLHSQMETIEWPHFSRK